MLWQTGARPCLAILSDPNATGLKCPSGCLGSQACVKRAQCPQESWPTLWAESQARKKTSTGNWEHFQWYLFSWIWLLCTRGHSFPITPVATWFHKVAGSIETLAKNAWRFLLEKVVGDVEAAWNDCLSSWMQLTLRQQLHWTYTPRGQRWEASSRNQQFPSWKYGQRHRDWIYVCSLRTSEHRRTWKLTGLSQNLT